MIEVKMNDKTVCFLIQGNPEESVEMKPIWCKVDEIPFESMWDDASYWLPFVLKGKRIKASFVYKDDNKIVGEAKIEEWGDGVQGR